MRDLLLSFQVSRFCEKGRLLIRAIAATDVFLAEIDMEKGAWSASKNGQRIAESGAMAPIISASREFQVDVSLFDHQFLFALGGKVLATYPFQGGGDDISANCTPFAIGIQNAGIEIGHLRIYRDVYYTHHSDSSNGGFLIQSN